MKEFSYLAGNAEEKKEMASLQVSSYLNLAACYQKTKDWANSFEACNYAISIDSSSGRAYFRRAQVYVNFAVFADPTMHPHPITEV
jgi:Tfp pilus assembly protein PilF